jgi:hypothetical protein
VDPPHIAALLRRSGWIDREPGCELLDRGIKLLHELIRLALSGISSPEHVFGTLKHWMGSTHFLRKTLAHVGTEMSLHVLAYNLKRVIAILGMSKTMKAVPHYSWLGSRLSLASGPEEDDPRAPCSDVRPSLVWERRFYAQQR